MEAQLSAAIDKLKELGLPETLTKQLETAKSQAAAPAAAAAAPPAEVATGLGVLLAIQDPAGAYLLGWQADQSGEAWLFTNTPTNPDVRPRASAWDGIGEAGFGAPAVHAAEDTAGANAGSAGKSVADQTDAPAPSEPAPSEPGPRKKNTPSGPITIPGG
jgi:hypothetical protein